MITLRIQLVGKPEMTIGEATRFISDQFSHDTECLIRSDPETGAVILKLEQDALSDAQRDWLHDSAFAARYVDSYKTLAAKE